ncbi:MAG: substrate-binding domain-containing protein [Clostridiales Family XIII bacterium]|jgi:ABC-type sugar transport system substrate-binding protein/predicted small secreted protein|nr:substrate-binding domain-containing protein [Clostridiales Family XIII bacterium]
MMNPTRKTTRTKAILIVLLVLAMSFSLIGCRNSTDSGDAGDGGSDVVDTNTELQQGGPNANEDGTTNLEQVAHFDPDFDYTQNKGFKMKYLVVSSGPLYEDFSKGVEVWAKNMNIQYDGIGSANGDSDLYINMLQEAIDQGYNCFILDPDTSVWPTIIEKLNEYPDVKWMSCMAPPRDINAEPDADGNFPLLHPHVGFDYYQNGVMCTEKLIEYKEANWPDVPWEEIGFVSYDFSIAPPLHVRTVGAEAKWMEVTGMSEDSIIKIDTASGQLDMNTAQELAQTAISTDTKHKYYLVSALLDDFAQGVSAALDSLGLTDKSCAVAIGGSAAIRQWDAGQKDAWQYAFFTAPTVYAEPIVGAIYAFMAGYANYDTIWPQWVNANDHGLNDHTYATMLLPSFWLDFDNYQKYMAWSDVYADSNFYKYPKEGITRDDFSTISEVPDYYKAKG